MTEPSPPPEQELRDRELRDQQLIAEFTIEPFEPARPGPHVQAALDVAERAASSRVTVDVGPFGTAIEGPAEEILALVNRISEAALAGGATRVSLQLTVVPHASGLSGDDA